MEYILLVFENAKNDQYVGVFPELDSVSSFGNTVQEAVDNTVEAANLYLEDLDKYPSDLGISTVLGMIEQEVQDKLTVVRSIEFWE
jgi:predicted RNase H-like HicB family nuclease